MLGPEPVAVFTWISIAGRVSRCVAKARMSVRAMPSLVSAGDQPARASIEQVQCSPTDFVSLWSAILRASQILDRRPYEPLEVRAANRAA
jgi:hypothetical protein